MLVDKKTKQKQPPPKKNKEKKKKTPKQQQKTGGKIEMSKKSVGITHKYILCSVFKIRKKTPSIKVLSYINFIVFNDLTLL